MKLVRFLIEITIIFIKFAEYVGNFQNVMDRFLFIAETGWKQEK